MVTVAVDGNGADLGPEEVFQGAALAARDGIHVLLFADASKIKEQVEGVEVIDAPVSIAKAEDPAFAVRATPEASTVQAAKAVADGRAQALVSGGSTGATLAAGLFNLKRDKGIFRPALALPMPRPGGGMFLILDVGANVNCRPEHLIQFAHMGSAFAISVLGFENAKVGLLSNGAEPVKGTADMREVHERLSGEEGAGLNFIGNVEGNDLWANGSVDVVVTDGFTGNIALKLVEGVGAACYAAVNKASQATLPMRLGARLTRPAMRALATEADPELTGGAFLLGLRQVGVVAHGRFSRRGFATAIGIAAKAVEQDVVTLTRQALSGAGAARQPPLEGGADPR